MVNIITAGVISSILSVLIIKLYDRYYISIKKLYQINSKNIRFCEGVIKSKEKEMNKPKNTFIMRGYNSLYSSNYLDLNPYEHHMLYPKYIQYDISSSCHYLKRLRNVLEIHKEYFIRDQLQEKYYVPYKCTYQYVPSFDDQFYVLMIKDFNFTNVILSCRKLSNKIDEYRCNQKTCIILFSLLLLYIAPFIALIR